MSPVNVELVNWKLQRRKKGLGALLDLVIIEAALS